MKVRYGFLSVLFFLIAWSNAALAQSNATDQLKSTVDGVLSAVADKTLESEARRTNIRALVDDRFDFESMSRRTVPKHWKKASAEIRSQFTTVFSDALANTYMGQIEDYQGQSVEYLGEKIKKEKYAQVDTKVISPNNAIPVNYRMELKEGQWRVYDVIIEGVSLVRNYRNAFKSIAKKKGLEGVIAELESNSAK